MKPTEGEHPLKVEKIPTPKVSYNNLLKISRSSHSTSSFNHLLISKSPSESLVYSRINLQKEVECFKEKRKFVPPTNLICTPQSSVSLDQSSILSSFKSSQSSLIVETNQLKQNNSNLRNIPKSFKRIKAPQKSVCKLEDCSKKLVISLCDGDGNLLMIDGCKESPRRFLDAVRNEESK